MPTSITVAPGLIQAPRINCGRPIAATRISARRHSIGQVARPGVGDRHRAVGARAAAPRAACRRCWSGRPRARAGRPDRRPASGAAGDAAHRRARHQEVGIEGAAAAEQPADVERMKAVDVLRRIDRIEHARGVDLVGQRQLDQDAVHRGVGVERAQPGEQVALADVSRQLEQSAVDADLGGHSRLGAHVGPARRMVADQDHPQAGRTAVAGGESVDLGGDLGAQLRGRRLAVDDPRPAHVAPASSSWAASMARSSASSAPARPGCGGPCAGRRRR